jgi:hypothetical protein
MIRHLRTLLLALLCGSTLLLSSCGITTPDTVHTESQTDREQRIGSLLKDYEKKIKELNAKTNAVSGAAREELSRALEDLKKKHGDAADGLEDLRASTNRSWKRVNADLQITLDELKKALDRAREQAR